MGGGCKALVAGPLKNNFFYGFPYLDGQENMLKSDPKASPSSNVLGRCVHRVSGRKRAPTPPRQLNPPIITRGRILLITP